MARRSTKPGVRIRSDLDEFRQRAETKALTALTEVIVLGASQAALYTPIDLSTLLNSQYRRILTMGTRLVGMVGYTADYAWYVHNPDVKQTFRVPTAEKEFLKKGFEDTKARADNIIATRMKA